CARHSAPARQHRPCLAARATGRRQDRHVAARERAHMILGRVIGTVVSTLKDEELDGLKFLVVKACDYDGKPTGAAVVAADAVGAGIGEVVLYASGSSARQTALTKDRPVDATIMAIVDEVEVDGVRRYVKDE